MREVILNYWNWFADLVNPYHDVINTISTIVIAAFAVVLARVALKQTRDARILQRAYLNVKFGGIQSDSAGELVGHVTFQNVGHLPARKLYWLVKLSRGGSDWRSPKIKSKELEGESVLPLGAEWPQGSKGLPDPQDRSPYQDEPGLYLYVWGRVTYKDGFRWRKKDRFLPLLSLANESRTVWRRRQGWYGIRPLSPLRQSRDLSFTDPAVVLKIADLRRMFQDTYRLAGEVDVSDHRRRAEDCR